MLKYIQKTSDGFTLSDTDDYKLLIVNFISYHIDPSCYQLDRQLQMNSRLVVWLHFKAAKDGREGIKGESQ